jgi:hypothetical protein
VQRELVSVDGLGVEAPADWKHLETPGTYLGHGRSERFGPADSATLEITFSEPGAEAYAFTFG